MLEAIIVFILGFAIVATLLWAAFQFFADTEDPLGDRLEELQTNSMIDNKKSPRRRAGGGRRRVGGIMKRAGVHGFADFCRAQGSA